MSQHFFTRGAAQRHPPHHPHKPTSQTLGARPPGQRMTGGAFLKARAYVRQPDGTTKIVEVHPKIGSVFGNLIYPEMDGPTFISTWR